MSKDEGDSGEISQAEYDRQAAWVANFNRDLNEHEKLVRLAQEWGYQLVPISTP